MNIINTLEDARLLMKLIEAKDKGIKGTSTDFERYLFNKTEDGNSPSKIFINNCIINGLLITTNSKDVLLYNLGSVYKVNRGKVIEELFTCPVFANFWIETTDRTNVFTLLIAIIRSKYR